MGFFETDADNVVKIVHAWTPKPARSEAGYETALYEVLHAAFPEERFEKQYANGKTRADIFVAFRRGAKVVVELKRNLTDRSEAHRLIGQMYEYVSEWKAEVVVVLCGKNDPAAVKLIKEAGAIFASAFAGAADRKVYVMEKAG